MFNLSFELILYKQIDLYKKILKLSWIYSFMEGIIYII